MGCRGIKLQSRDSNAYSKGKTADATYPVTACTASPNAHKYNLYLCALIQLRE